jgi:hypothetical protein
VKLVNLWAEYGTPSGGFAQNNFGSAIHGGRFRVACTGRTRNGPAAAGIWRPVPAVEWPKTARLVYQTSSRRRLLRSRTAALAVAPAKSKPWFQLKN